MEELALGTVIQTSSIPDLKNYYTEELYKNEKKLLNSIQKSYPSQYKDYTKHILQLDQNSVCKYSKYAKEGKQSECEAAAQGIL